MREADITAVLVTLWRRPETTLSALAAAVTRTTDMVRRALDVLADRGCVLERTPTTIRLVTTALACWRDIIEATAEGRPARLGCRTLVFQTTASTNDVCFRAKPTSTGLVVLADQQTAGRGRRGHVWAARPGQSVLLSILLPHPAPTSAPSESLTLLLGLAVAEALESVAPVDAEIKWPNDVFLAGRKVAGVLVEQRGAATVLGVGVNVAQATADFPPVLRKTATSLYLATGRQIDRLAVISAILDRIAGRCFASTPPETWLPAWKARCPLLGQTLELRTGGTPSRPGPKVRGRILDIDPLQGLLLRDDHGATRFCPAATTTISHA